MPVKITILAPDGPVLEDLECYQAELPGLAGEFGVMADHTPLVAPLAIGEIRILSAEATVGQRIAIAGGFVEVGSDGARVTARAAEPADAIDVDRAKSAQARAEQRLSSRPDDLDVARAEAALARATNRLRIVSKHLG